MRLLFKEQGFSKDFKELLGFVDADMTFRNIKPELRSATKEMIRFIGSDFYDLVADTYGILNDDSSSEFTPIKRLLNGPEKSKKSTDETIKFNEQKK